MLTTTARMSLQHMTSNSLTVEANVHVQQVYPDMRSR